MATRPADRYPGARALVFDVERWLADVPVSVYREPFRRRLARWERRHKNLVHGGVTALAIAAVGLAVIGAAVSREKEATEAARKKAEVSALTAQADLHLAADTVFYLSQVSDVQLNRVPGSDGVRKDMTNRAYRLFQDILKRGGSTDPRLLRLAERVYLNAGKVRWLIGDFPGAKAAYGDEIQVCEQALKLPPDDSPTGRSSLATAYREMADFLQDNGRDREAAAYFTKARRLAERLVAEFDGLSPVEQKEVRRGGGWTAVKHGEFQRGQGAWDDARRSYRQGIDLLTPLAGNPREWYWYRLYIGWAHRGLGEIATEAGDAAAAEREFAEAIRIDRGVLAERKDREPDPCHDLGITLYRYGRSLAADRARAGDAEAAFDEAVHLLRGICDESPGVYWYHRDLAEALTLRAARHAAAGRDAAAEADLDQARRLLTDLIARAPEDWINPGHLARVDLELGRLRLRQKRSDEARRLLGDAVRRLEAVTRDRPGAVGDLQSLDQARAALREATGRA
jgi:tetratricopeptide (TPR) repeat protein